MNYQFIVDFHVVDVKMLTIQKYSTDFQSDNLDWLMEQVYSMVQKWQDEKDGFSKCYVKIYRRENTQLILILDGYIKKYGETFFFS